MSSESYVDLHLHTNHSDGSDAPQRVVERAAEAQLAAIAITDHDTLSGLDEARRAAANCGIEFLAGTEISAECNQKELHILGLGLQCDHPALNEALADLVARRSERADEIVARLNELGVPVLRENIEARTAKGTIGRVHIAQEIVETGHAKTVQDAFDKFIKKGKPAFVSKKAIPCGEAVDLIHAAGGLAFIAHPGIGNQRQRLAKLLSFPFDGLEAYHSRHSEADTKFFMGLASERQLLVTGGSDCHGTVKGEKPLMGRARVPLEVFARIREALEG